MSSKALSWVSRGLRVSVAGTFVVVAFGAVALHMGSARASDAALGFGQQLTSIAEGRYSSGAIDESVYHVSLNGQGFDSSNALTRRPMHEVLSHFATQCKTHAEGLADSFKDLDVTVRNLAPSTKGEAGALIFQRETVDRGFVFCVAPDHAMTEPELMGQLSQLSKTGDLGSIGNMRYVTVEATPMGSRRVVAAWTEGKFQLYNLFSAAGDSPGQDFAGVPRPEGGRRTMSATIDGAPGGYNAYLVKGTRAEVLAGLDKKLTGTGWEPVFVPAEVPHVGRAYSLGSKLDLVVSASEQDEGHVAQTLVGYIVSRGIPMTSR